MRKERTKHTTIIPGGGITSVVCMEVAIELRTSRRGALNRAGEGGFEPDTPLSPVRFSVLASFLLASSYIHV